LVWLDSGTLFFYDNRFAETDLSFQPNFKLLAEACGGIGYDVTTKEEFDKALKDAIEKKRVAMINVSIDRFENVLPMVPAGGALYNMILADVKGEVDVKCEKSYIDLVENESSVLSRVSGLFAGRGYNIENFNSSTSPRDKPI